MDCKCRPLAQTKIKCFPIEMTTLDEAQFVFVVMFNIATMTDADRPASIYKISSGQVIQYLLLLVNSGRLLDFPYTLSCANHSYSFNELSRLICSKLPYILAYRSHHRIGRTMNFVLKKLNLGLTRR